MYDFSFICRNSKQDKQGLSPIELSIVIDGKRTYVSLPLKCSSIEFKKKITSKRNNDILEYTSAIRTKLNKHINDMMGRDIAVTAQSLKEYFVNGGVKSYMLSQLKADYLTHYQKKVDCGVATSQVYRKYELAIEKFIAYIGKDIEADKITAIDIDGFYLELSKTMQRTSANYVLVRLKTFFIFACNGGKLKLNPFNNFTIDRKPNEVEKLDKSEIEVIKKKMFVGRLDKVRDLFLFQCYTALSYVDMCNLTYSDIQYSDGIAYVNKPRQKTKVNYFAVINSDAMAILEKYDYQLPILSNQKYNAYLKEIGDICNISKSLHSHLARHTCATQLLNDGMSLDIVAKVLGHTNTRQTMQYAKLLDNTVIEAFKKLG